MITYTQSLGLKKNESNVYNEKKEGGGGGTHSVECENFFNVVYSISEPVF